MNKTIEEAAKEYYLNEVVNGDTCDDKDGWTDCFVSGAAALMQLPLASRLTAEEKERVRTKYNAAKIGATEFDSPECADLMDMLEDIFGADFFKGGE